MRPTSALLLVALAISPGGRAAGAEASVASFRARVETEAVPAWEAYVAFAKSIQGRGTSNSVYRSNGKEVPETHVIEVKQNRNAALMTRSPLPEGTMAAGQNSQYAFVIVRADPSSDWLIKKVTRDRNASLMLYSPGPVDEAARDYACLHFAIPGGTRLPDFFRDPSFQIQSVRSETSDGVELFRVSFLNTSKAGAAPGRILLRDGWFRLDLRHYWCMVDGQIRLEFPDGGGQNVQFWREFVADRERRPILKQIRLKKAITMKDKVVATDDVVTDFDFTVRDDVPESEFTLSAFGLPEPAGVKWPKPTPAFVWILLVAAALAAAAFGFRYLARRARAAV